MNPDSMPNGLLGGPAPVSDSPHGQMLGALQDNFAAAKFKLKKINEAAKLAEAMQASLDLLVKQGDAVSPDDVIDAASDIVAKGGSPQQLATLLADMPAASGVGLSGWLAQKDLALKKATMNVKMAQKQAQLELATTSLAHLMGHSIAHRATSATAPLATPAPAPNPLGGPTNGP